MARPWQEYVHKFSLVDAFVKNNIGMILNLQEVCGRGLLYDRESCVGGDYCKTGKGVCVGLLYDRERCVGGGLLYDGERCVLHVCVGEERHAVASEVFHCCFPY